MRQIKFRAWDKRTNEMFTDGLVVSKDGILCCFNGENQCEIMQFTGLNDKNGKEIYEGDIVVVKSENNKLIGRVFWEIDRYRIADKMWVNSIYRLNEFDLKVIGNIYENPELLTN